LLETEEKIQSELHLRTGVSSPLTEPGLNKLGNLLGEVHVVAVARQ